MATLKLIEATNINSDLLQIYWILKGGVSHFIYKIDVEIHMRNILNLPTIGKSNTQYYKIDDSLPTQLFSPKNSMKNEIGWIRSISDRIKTFVKAISISSQIDPNKFDPYDYATKSLIRCKKCINMIYSYYFEQRGECKL